ncbi:hypothetical protein [Treponema primitia]|nr:hypothetical protein [Treponema primitia]
MTETVIVTKPGEIIYVTPDPEDNGKLTIENDTEGQTIHFIRIKYPDGTYKVIPADVGTGDNKELSLPAGNYEVSISEDGIYYSSVEPVSVEPGSVEPDGKILDTGTKFQPPLWWKTGGHNDPNFPDEPGYDPEYPEWNPNNPNNPESGDLTTPGTDTDGTTPNALPGWGHLKITNNSNYPVDIIKVTYLAWPDGSTKDLPAISSENPTNELTFTLDPALKPPATAGGVGDSITLALHAGKYKVELGYKGGNKTPAWLGQSEKIVKEGETATIELQSDGGNSGGGTTPPTDTKGSYYIVVKNQYKDTIVNAINVYQMPESAPGGTTTLAPNPTGIVVITPPLYFGDIYYYKVPTTGKYKVRMGFYDPSLPPGPGNPFWYNAPSDDDDPDHPADWTEPTDEITVGTDPNFGETNKDKSTDYSGANNNPGKTGDTQSGASYYIAVRNDYTNTNINVINVYQVPGSAQTAMEPNPSGLVFINPPLAPGQTYYYQVPSRGTYKVRMGYYDPTKPIGPGNPLWFNASNDDEDPGNPTNWDTEPKNTVVIGTTPPFGETTIKDEPKNNTDDPNNKGKITGPVIAPHQWAYLKVVNTGKNKIYAVLATNRSSDDTLHPADAAHENKPWFDYGGDATRLGGLSDMTKSAVRNKLHNSTPYLATNEETDEMEVPPGEMYVHIYRSNNSSSTVYHESIKINTYIDVLTIVRLKDTTWESYPEYTTPTALRDITASVGSVTIINRESTKGHIPIQEILISNYAEAEKVVALTDVNSGLYTAYIDWKAGYVPNTDQIELAAGTAIPSNKKTSSSRSGKIPNVLSMNQYVPPQSSTNAGTLENWHDGTTFGVPQNSSITFNLKPGLYRVAVRTTRDDHWYGGKTLYFWKAVHIREGVSTVFTFDGYHLEP